MRSDFCAMIMSHKRPDTIFTLKTLLGCGYTGKWFILVDDEDPTRDEYLKKYGDHVKIFSLSGAAAKLDQYDKRKPGGAIVYARNACFDVAIENGIKYFVELDDDYDYFAVLKNENGVLSHLRLRNIDKAFNAMIDFLETDKRISSVAFSQGGDLIGGVQNPHFKKRLLRKCMNSFFCSTEKRFPFSGRINEDVNTYSAFQSRGNVFFTVVDLFLNQKQTQKNSGGMTELYLDSGTYVKSFYSIIACPSAVKISVMGYTHERIHHRVNFVNCAPKILSERFRKHA